jgi:hypothetical protein
MASSETETEATLLTETQFDWEHHNLCNRCEKAVSKKRRGSRYKLFVIIEAVQILVVLLGFGLYSLSQSFRDSTQNQCKYFHHRSSVFIAPTN